YARTTPKHKLRIVTSLQAANHIVAMTGDGVNDAPALKKADVGVAMGKSGTEVAKEAAEMVIIDDNFATIVSAIREGRSIYANIRKFIYYLLTTTISQVVLILLSTLMGVPAPLTALMILFVNLLTSDFPAIGIALERPADNIMKQAPRDPREGIINEPLMYKMLHVTPLFVLGIILFFMWNLQTKHHTVIEAQTISFVTLTLFCVFHALNSKSLDQSIFGKQFFSNIPLLMSLVFSVLMTMVVVYWRPAQIVFGTTGLPAADWLPLIFTSVAVIAWVELEKAMINAEIAQRDRSVIQRMEKP
ncbi:MAG TPA: HAD-IC family P-type ATPase, partial [Acidobacteriota bacterium]|nr:HAD-IC family P-type ATPase [Acidobacteriota bacterium]